jgi:hypothetical protein
MKNVFVKVLLFVVAVGFFAAAPVYANDFGRLAGQIVGSVVVAAVDGTSCAAVAEINDRARGSHDRYDRYARRGDYDRCINQQRQERREQEYRARAQYEQQRAEQARMYREAQREAPRCQYFEQGGRVFRNCSETVYGEWR